MDGIHSQVAQVFAMLVLESSVGTLVLVFNSTSVSYERPLQKFFAIEYVLWS